MAFESLTEKLQNVFRNLRSKGKLTEADVKASLKEVLDKMVGSPEQLQKMGRESYRLIQEKYQIENYLEGIETLLAKLGEER